MTLTNEQYLKIFEEFREEFSCVADDKQLKKWGHTEEVIKDIKIASAKEMVKFREDGIRLKIFIDNIGGCH